MKKRSLILLTIVLSFSVLFATTGYAKTVTKKISAVFGSYVIKMNGKTQKTETLATGSKVYIPVTEIPRLTGASVKKDGKTYNITPVNKEQIKIMVRIMDMYNTLDGKLDGAYLISHFVHFSYDDIKQTNSPDTLNQTIAKYNTLLKTYDNTIYQINDLVKSSAAKGYNMRTDENHFNNILSDYEKSLNEISKALDVLKEYYETENEQIADSYIDNVNSGIKYGFDGREKAFNRYKYYFNTINKQ
jgi:hypothetical protein